MSHLSGSSLYRKQNMIQPVRGRTRLTQSEGKWKEAQQTDEWYFCGFVVFIVTATEGIHFLSLILVSNHVCKGNKA